MQLLKDNYTLWGVDIKAVTEKKRAAGHIVDLDGDGVDDDEGEGGAEPTGP